MINIASSAAPIDPVLWSMVTKLKRGHVSRYPLLVTWGVDWFRIADSRFPTQTARLIDCVLLVTKERDSKRGIVYELGCMDISNEKFKVGNRKYRTRETCNTALLSKWLKEYATSFSPARINGMTPRDFSTGFSAWQAEAAMAYATASSDVKMPELIEELARQQELGTVFFSEKIRNLAKAGPALIAERKRRNNALPPTTLLFCNPDETWIVSQGQNNKVVNSFDLLSEETHNNIAMLRMVSDGTFVPEVGHRIDYRTFWVSVAFAEA